MNNNPATFITDNALYPMAVDLTESRKDVVVVPEYIYDYFNCEFTRKMVLPYADGWTNRFQPLVFKISVPEFVSEKPDFRISDGVNISEFTSISDGFVYFTNLTPDTKYTWEFYSSYGVVSSGCFETAVSQPRELYVSGVSNIRDIGGYKLPHGSKTAYGKLFRSANIDKVRSDGINVLSDDLGIKTEIDLRNPGDGADFVNIKFESRGVSYNNLRTTYYQMIFDNAYSSEISEIRRVFSILASPKNYPILVHCKIGMDRTGTIIALLQGLLGVSIEDIFREYMLSWFSDFKETDGANERLDDFANMCDILSSYKSSDLSLSENVRYYLRDIGVSCEEIESIANIFTCYSE